MFWATVGMMLLTAAEELITLFLTLETMTICLYLSTALEKTKRRSAEGGLKYFVYGSVSSALFLFGLSLLYGLTGTTQFEAIRRLLVDSQENGLSGNLAGAMAVLLMMVGFGFKVAAVPFHQWAPDAYEGAPAPVTAWIATGSKLASFVALMKVFLHGLIPWSNPSTSIMAAGLDRHHRDHLGRDDDLRQFRRTGPAELQAHAGVLVNRARRIHPRRGGGGEHRDRRTEGRRCRTLLLNRLRIRQRRGIRGGRLARPRQDDRRHRRPQRAGVSRADFGHVYPSPHALVDRNPAAGRVLRQVLCILGVLDQRNPDQPVTLLWLVALGLFNSVVSAFYYVRVLKAMFLREPGPRRLSPATRPIELPIVLGTLVVVVFGIMPSLLVGSMEAAATTMLTGQLEVRPLKGPSQAAGARTPPAPASVPPLDMQQYEARMKAIGKAGGGGMTKKAQTKGSSKKGGPPGAAKGKAQAKGKGANTPKSAPTPAKSADSPPAKG